MKPWIAWLAASGAAIFAGIQFVPVARTNPPVEFTAEWDSPRTRELFYRACADCHSHETRWPWYSRIAPASWLVSNHVRDGRRDMNISVPDEVDATEAVEEIREGTMPPADYKLMHPEARLTEEERTALISGLKKSF